ncbi:MAG: hypothetical protein OXI22_09465 [Defluviicoccus sp.]|nr:hypothetical protein [Defluviicoccus sp.]
MTTLFNSSRVATRSDSLSRGSAFALSVDQESRENFDGTFQLGKALTDIGEIPVQAPEECQDPCNACQIDVSECLRAHDRMLSYYREGGSSGIGCAILGIASAPRSSMVECIGMARAIEFVSFR